VASAILAQEPNSPRHRPPLNVIENDVPSRLKRQQSHGEIEQGLWLPHNLVGVPDDPRPPENDDQVKYFRRASAAADDVTAVKDNINADRSAIL
jgi:hypothetical protein